MKYLSVKNFEHFQHYKDRAPVWIKLYNAVMDDEAFLELSDAERGQLVLIWLLASRRDNKIPNDGKHIARAIQSSGRVNLERFVKLGFLVAYQSASDVLAESEQPASTNGAEPEHDASPHARPRARGEGEKRREEKIPPTGGRPRPAGEPTFNLAPYLAAHDERFPGASVSGGRFGKALKPLEQMHGPAETLRRWKVFLPQKGELGPEYFARTWSEWSGEPAPAANGAPARVPRATEGLIFT